MSMYGKNHYNIKEKKIKEYFKSKKEKKRKKENVGTSWWS